MSESKHTLVAMHVAGIIMGGKARIETVYGFKNIEGITDLIERETGLPDLLAALQRAVDACNAHNEGGSMDYDWIGQAEVAINKAASPGTPPLGQKAIIAGSTSTG